MVQHGLNYTFAIMFKPEQHHFVNAVGSLCIVFESTLTQVYKMYYLLKSPLDMPPTYIRG